MEADFEHTDINRLEVLAREAYNLMAATMANYGCMESLIRLKQFIKAKRKARKPYFSIGQNQMGYHVFPFLTDLMIRHCTTLAPTRQLDENTLNWLIGKYVDFPEMAQLPSGHTNINRYVPEVLIRMAFEQLPTQETTRTLVPRMLFLYREIPNMSQSRHRYFVAARDEVLKRQFKVNLDDLLLCTFSLGAIANLADTFSEPLSTDMDWMKPHVESDAMPIVLSQLSLSRAEYCKLADDQFSGSHTFIKTEPLLIFRYPIVRFDKCHICIDPFLLLNRMTKLLHSSVYQYFIDNDRLQEYSGTFGEVYKDYIGILLKSCYGEQAVLDLDQFGELSGRKADWMVVVGDSAAIFECKAQRYPRELRRSGRLEVLESFLNERIGPAVNQLTQTEKQWSVIRKGFPLARRAKRILKFVVLEEHFHLANVVGDFLPDNSTVRCLKESDTHIVSTLDLETIACSNYASNFAMVFAGWLDSITEFPALQQHVQNLPGFEFTDDNFLEKKFNEFFHKSDHPPV